MVQTIRARGADVHAWPAPHRLEPFEYRNISRAIRAFFCLYVCLFLGHISPSVYPKYATNSTDFKALFLKRCVDFLHNVVRFFICEGLFKRLEYEPEAKRCFASFFKSIEQRNFYAQLPCPFLNLLCNYFWVCIRGRPKRHITHNKWILGERLERAERVALWLVVFAVLFEIGLGEIVDGWEIFTPGFGSIGHAQFYMLAFFRED